MVRGRGGFSAWEVRRKFPSVGRRRVTPPHGYLTMINVPPDVWAYGIEDRRLVIGRSAEAEIQIPSQYTYVSRRHAEIWIEKNKILLADIGSKAGTRVNGLWLKKLVPTRLVAGDRIWLGQVQLTVVADLAPVPSRVIHSETSEIDPLDESEDSGMPTLALPVQLALEKLTPVERDVALWLSRGYFDDKELGAILHRSPNTVRTQVGSIMRKLSLRSRHDIIAFLKQGD